MSNYLMINGLACVLTGNFKGVLLSVKAKGMTLALDTAWFYLESRTGACLSQGTNEVVVFSFSDASPPYVVAMYGED